MKIHDAMSRDVRTVGPEATIRDAARLLAEYDIGILPVASGERLAGMITDRDIAIRAVAMGKGPDCTVADVMSAEVLYCRDDDDVADVCKNMADIQVRRLPVVDAEKRLVGIVSLADIARTGSSGEVGKTLGGIIRPSGVHTQTLNATQF